MTRAIKQNLFFALSTTRLACPLPRVLYPLSPMVGAATMSFSSVSIIANALRLRREKI
jgi:P-type Cu+ transporter